MNCKKCDALIEGDGLTPEGLCFECEQGAADGDVGIPNVRELGDCVARGLARKLDIGVGSAKDKLYRATVEWKNRRPA